MKAANLQRIKYLKSYEVTRSLPYPGEILVSPGDNVNAAQHLGAAKVSILSETLPYVGQAVVTEGFWVKGGDTLARSGLFTKKTSLAAPFAGTVTEVNKAKKTILLASPKRDFFLVAGLAGKVTAVSLAVGSVTVVTPGIQLRGVCGLGFGCGELVAASDLDGESSNGKVVFTEFLDSVLLTKAKTLGVSAIIAGGVDWETYISARTVPGFGLVLLGGFGHLPVLSDVLKIIKERLGKFVTVSGESRTVFIPTVTQEKPATPEADLMGRLTLGARVKIFAWPHFGEGATVIELLDQEFKFDSGVVASAVRVKFGSNEEMIVPVESVGILV